MYAWVSEILLTLHIDPDQGQDLVIEVTGEGQGHVTVIEEVALADTKS